MFWRKWSVGPPAPTVDLADAVLLERYVQQGDQAAFAALVARYGALVLRVCRRFLGDKPEVEDAFQAAFVVLARKATSLRQPNALPGWLHAVARRVALKARAQVNERSAGRADVDETLPDPRPDPLTQLTARELLEIVDEEVRRLPQAQRSVVLLCCLEGCSREEAARRLGCTPSGVKNHLQRGRRRLQARLQRRGIALPAALAIGAVSHGEAAPALLLRNTITAVQSDGIGSAVSSLAHSALKTMFLTKLATITAIVLTIALAAASTIAMVSRRPAEVPEYEERGRAARPITGREGPAPAPRTDVLGDPLPPGAIARLSTMRFRHSASIRRIIFSADGKNLISKGDDGVRVWDTATGKELHSLTAPPGENWTQATDLSADGEGVAVIHGPNSAIDLWDLRRGQKIDSFGRGDYSLVCISPDRKLIAVCVKMSGIEIWDIARREKLRSWKAQKWQVWYFAFTADSRRLFTSGTEGKHRLWDVATGQKLQEFDIPNYSVQSLTSYPLSPDGKWLAVIENLKPGKSGGEIFWRACISAWDTATGKQIQQLPKDRVKKDEQLDFRAWTFTADGKHLLTSGADRFLRVWDPLTGKMLRKVPFDSQGASVLVFSKDGKTLAAASGMAIHLIDWPSGKTHEPPEGRATASADNFYTILAPDGKTAVTASSENAFLLWDATTGQVRQRLGKPNNYLMSLQISREGKTLYACDADKMLRIWDLSRGAERSQVQLSFFPASPRHSLVAPDNRSLFFADSDGIIHQLDAATGKEHNRIQGPKYLWGIACRPDGQSLVGWSGDRKIRIWDTKSCRIEREYTVPKNIKGKYGFMAPNQREAISIYPAVMSPDGRLLAMGSLVDQLVPDRKQQYALLFKELRTGRDLTHCDPLPSAPEVLAFSPDGRMLAWSGSFMDSAIHLLEVASGRERLRLVGHRGRVQTLHFSTTGQRLLSGSVDTTALVWDLGIDRAGGPAAGAELDALWTALAGEDAARAYRAIRKLASAPKAALPFLRKHLRPVPVVDEKRLAHLIADLDSDNFAMRQQASEELTALGEQAIAAYRKALAGKLSLEQRRRLDDLLEKAQRVWWRASGERLRFLRAIEVLELADTLAARELLATLAAGAEGARQTAEAKAALQRLANRKHDGSP